MRGNKGKSQKGFSTMNLVLEAVSAADREAAEANQSRYLYHMGVLKHDQGAEVRQANNRSLVDMATGLLFTAQQPVARPRTAACIKGATI